MFSAVFDKVTGLFDQRFMLGLFLPALAFAAGVGALVATTIGWAATLSWCMHLAGFDQTLLVVAGLGAVAFAATFLGTQVVTLTQVFEGYWPASLGRRLKRRQLRKRNNLDNSDADTLRRYQRYPVDDDVLPTELGNVLRSAERYPGDTERWGLDAVFWWPRLYLVIPDSARQQVDGTRTTLDQMVVLATLASLFSVTSIGFAGSTPVAVWLPCAGGALALGYLSYRAAVSAAVVFGELVRSCFDLYRGPLLDSLGWDQPATWADERALWQTLQQQLYRRGTSEDSPVLIGPRRQQSSPKSGARRPPRGRTRLRPARPPVSGGNNTESPRH